MILTAYLFLLNDHPDDRSRNLGPFQMLVGRSVIGLFVMIIWLNCGLKRAVWDSLKRDKIRPLVFRSIQGTFTNTILFGSTKFLPLTTIAIIVNLQPLLTLVMAYSILKEKIRWFEVVMIVLSVASVIVFSLFGEDQHTKSQSFVPMWTYYAALSTSPLLSAGATVAMRSMKKLHDAAVSWYLNLSILATSLAVVLIS